MTPSKPPDVLRRLRRNILSATHPRQETGPEVNEDDEDFFSSARPVEHLPTPTCPATSPPPTSRDSSPTVPSNPRRSPSPAPVPPRRNPSLAPLPRVSTPGAPYSQDRDRASSSRLPAPTASTNNNAPAPSSRPQPRRQVLGKVVYRRRSINNICI
ncbi:hypothetical protein C8J57DRAFT_1363943, partial [Mycena rebaudengoi]